MMTLKTVTLQQKIKTPESLYETSTRACTTSRYVRGSFHGKKNIMKLQHMFAQTGAQIIQASSERRRVHGGLRKLKPAQEIPYSMKIHVRTLHLSSSKTALKITRFMILNKMAQTTRNSSWKDILYMKRKVACRVIDIV